MPHILLIEDNPGDAVLIREMYRDSELIGDEFRLSHVPRVKDAVEKLQVEHDIDLILSDITLPDSAGLQTLRTLTEASGNLPVIFMTGTNNESFVDAALKAGAQDYLVKDRINTEALVRTTTYAIERKKAQIKIAAALRKAEALAQSTELLKQQKQQLLKLNQAKDEFISLASHQLRTPATSVKQYLGMMLAGYAGQVPEHLLVFLRTAYDSNERQLDIINDLLKTAQLDSGRFQLVKEPVDLSRLVQTTVDEYMPIVTMRQQTIAYVPAESCFVNIDAGEMKVVIANLIENASKYSPESSLITVRVEKRKKQIRLQVEDSGVGIPEAELTKIFDKFIRLDNELSDTVSGSGLGLYFVKRIVRLHGGRLNVESTLGKGSTFTVLLPE